MAAIDKIYGSPDEWEEMYSYLGKKPDLRKYMYPKPESHGPLSNFPVAIDYYLIEQPDLPGFMRARIFEQYGSTERRAKNIDKNATHV